MQVQARVTADPGPDFARGYKTPELSKEEMTVDGLTRALVAGVDGPVTWWEPVLWPNPLAGSCASSPDLSVCTSQLTVLPASAG